MVSCANVRIAVHDASRIEWVASLPFPDGTRTRDEYTVEFELEVPSQLFVAHELWRSLHVMSRLQSPERAQHAASIDDLRELALSVAHRAKQHRDSFARECALAGLMSRVADHGLVARITALVTAVERDVVAARTLLGADADAAPALAGERALVAEFVSNQLLDFVFHARCTLDRGGTRPDTALAQVTAAYEQAIQAPLRRELADRHARGFVTPTSDDPTVLAAYLERASELKKHFHALLFLATETTSVDARLKNLGAIGGGMLASIFGFILNKTGLVASSAALGLVVAALVGAVVYTVQDRIKDLGKTALPARLGRRRAQRITRLLVPPRSCHGDARLAGTLAEAITAKLAGRPDPLNPQLGVSRAVHVVRYTARGTTVAQPELRARGITSLKQIFRYDLSWLLPRLDDARKPVPVFAADAVLVAAASRCYRMPVRVRLSCGEGTWPEIEVAAIAVMHKGGLERLESVSEQRVDDVTLLGLAREPVAREQHRALAELDDEHGRGMVPRHRLAQQVHGGHV
jgi:hypothetical protein